MDCPVKVEVGRCSVLAWHIKHGRQIPQPIGLINMPSNNLAARQELSTYLEVSEMTGFFLHRLKAPPPPAP